jgi:hypothetical protein
MKRAIMPIAKGQFACTSTSGWKSRVIQIVTASEVNHAIICVNDNGTCMEAQPSGAKETHASNYPNAIWSDWNLTEEQADMIANWAIYHKGTPYGWLDCVAAGWNALHQRWKWVPESKWVYQRLMDLGTMDCSQFVSEAYAFAGITICKDELPCEVSPGDLYNVVKAMRENND